MNKQFPQRQELTASVPVKLLTAGTAACIADFITFPLDTAKVRLQVRVRITFDLLRLLPKSLTLDLLITIIFVVFSFFSIILGYKMKWMALNLQKIVTY